MKIKGLLGAAVATVLLVGAALPASAATGRGAHAKSVYEPERTVTITLGSGPMLLDAYDYAGMDFRTVIRPSQNNATQWWGLTKVGPDLYRITQLATNQYLDAYDYDGSDYASVTRPFQNNNTQLWRVYDYGGGFATIQQVSTGRFLEGRVFGDMRVVTRPYSGSNAQTWRIIDRW